MGRKKHAHRHSDNYGAMQYDAQNPRLATLRQIRFENKIKDQLLGEDSKRGRAKVSLPKFSWDKKDG